MDEKKFDDLTRTLATGTTRRQFLKRLAAGTTGGMIANFSVRKVLAQTECLSFLQPCSADSECCTGDCRRPFNLPFLRRRCLCPIGSRPCSAGGPCCPFGTTCLSGVCQDLCPSGITCDDGDACTTDSCDPVIGCNHTPINCDDGNACTVDACDPASGCAHTAINCDDGNACTSDTCDAASGCVHTPINCDDSNACTVDSCDPVSGCIHAQVSCDDCLTCAGGSCVADPSQDGDICQTGDNAEGVCSGGLCLIETPCGSSGPCGTGLDCCNEQCVNLNSDPDNCGDCGVFCLANPGGDARVCTNGMCGCAIGFGLCDYEPTCFELALCQTPKVFSSFECGCVCGNSFPIGFLPDPANNCACTCFLTNDECGSCCNAVLDPGTCSCVCTNTCAAGPPPEPRFACQCFCPTDPCSEGGLRNPTTCQCSTGNPDPTCPPETPFRCPAGECVNIQTDRENCGGCSFDCLPAQICVEGLCGS